MLDHTVPKSEPDTTIDVGRWICVAEEEICWVDGALNALGAEPTKEGIEIHGLANLDAPGVAEYLRSLATKLQVVATNLTYLADHANLTELAAGLEVAASKPDDRTLEELLDLLTDPGLPKSEEGA
jgi:hypothetical protein